MSRPSFARDVLLGLWAASALVCSALLAASGWLTPERLDAGALWWVGACPAKLAGRPCALCGMSHSFAAMASLRWQAAAAFHPWGPWLFLVVFLNTVTGLWSAIRRLGSRKEVLRR